MNNEETVLGTATGAITQQETSLDTDQPIVCDAKPASPYQLSFKIESVRPDFCYAWVIIPKNMVDVIYHEAASSQQHSAQTYGFHHGAVPIQYIKQNFKENLVEHLKELLFKFCVIDYLYEQIRIQKLVVAGDPRLHDIKIEPNQDAQFIFELSLYPDLTIYEWKYFPFKAPKRKNYKDLDRQVETFVEIEKKRLSQITSDELTVGDWVGFNLSFVDKNDKPLLENFSQDYWFKLGEDETESPLRSIFLGRRQGEAFYSHDQTLQEYFSHLLDTDYHFKISITNALPYEFFCFEQFKRTFRIKTNKEMHKKLIEVFSYRNDVSQRHAMVEEAFNALLSKHQMNIPNHLILRRQKILLERMKNNPDYNVYRVQKNFQDQIRKLAIKQTTEMVFIDKLAYQENLYVSDDDVKGYLNLLNRPRMKEFIYFDLPLFKIQGQEMPIPSSELKRICLREKAINYVVYHLTKK